MNKIQYKGFIIKAHPQQLVKNDQWTVNILIEKHRGDSVSNKQFSAANTFPTKEEATKHCLNFGMQVVDNQIDGCSVFDL